MIQVRQLTKVYRVPVKQGGFWASLKSVWNRQYRDVRAVDRIDFDIARGERVGFLGPNGAGKTTTLKMLTGLLHPTSGHLEVLGFRPQDRRPEFLKQVTLVMGQKQQLLWDLPPLDTFALNRALFDIPHAQYRETLDELVELLDLTAFLDQPTRNLSLGQRMRAELAASLLHRPKVLFLDEPTIGLDVEVTALVRKFIAEYNRRYDATVMLTSHNMSDVASIAQRIILIDKGAVRFDGSLEALSQRFGGGRRVVANGPAEILGPLGFQDVDGRCVATVEGERVNEVLAAVLQQLPHAEVTVEDPPLEEVISRAFGTKDEDVGAPACP
ncbi:MAG: ATP-binding cassette domain-containing protein [Deltaproteobacteria bacterium]|nr:ATP-binding cassette domain-containing protein [Deltaproteobacteria bacterium]